MSGGCHVKPEQFFNLIFGYHDTYYDHKGTDNASAGHNFLEGDTVPAGEIWICNAITARNIDTACAWISYGPYDGTTWYPLIAKTSPGVNEPIRFDGLMVLKAGWRIRVGFGNCTAGDDIDLWIIGYKMKLTQ